MLSQTTLRKDALSILEAGMDVIQTRDVLAKKVRLEGELLKVGRRSYDLKKYHRIFVVGIGKVSLTAAAALEDVLGDRIADGVVLDVKKGRLKYIASIAGTHPYPSEENIRGATRIAKLVKEADSRDLVIAIISGGGSALLCMPHQMACMNLVDITRLLMKNGADIHELNTVRKHLSEVQGGQLARMAHPATVVSLIFSDVPGDDISMVASGPTVLDPTSVEDAARILTKYNVIKACKLPSCELVETPKDPLLFRHVQNELIVGNTVALAGMKAEARRLGYKVRVLTAELSGEAREVGEHLVRMPAAGEVVLAAGETTVTVTKSGKGGRNQEVALGALNAMSKDRLLLSFASDGIDHTPVAGGIADQLTLDRAAKKSLEPEEVLRENASYDFFQETKSYIRTGITGVNISDLVIAMKEKRE